MEKSLKDYINSLSLFDKTPPVSVQELAKHCGRNKNNLSLWSLMTEECRGEKAGVKKILITNCLPDKLKLRIWVKDVTSSIWHEEETIPSENINGNCMNKNPAIIHPETGHTYMLIAVKVDSNLCKDDNPDSLDISCQKIIYGPYTGNDNGQEIILLPAV